MSTEGVFKKTINLSNQEMWIIILIIISATALRIWDLGSMGFNNDEAIYSGQAATLAGYKEFSEYFSIYRAHPLLLQFMISILFGIFGIGDVIARIIPAILGILTVLVTYLIGKVLFNRRLATVSALVIAILPYHIIISRQVLLDVSLAFFYALSLLFMALHFKNPKNFLCLFLIGTSAGLSFLSKEVGIFALFSSIVCMVMIKSLSLRNLIIVVSAFLLASSPHWIPILTIDEAQEAALAYWNWQTGRYPNQPNDFYLNLISQEALGYILTGLFLLSIIYSLKTKNIKRPNVFIPLIWIAIPLIIMQFIAVKGFAFVSPLIPPFVLLGVSFLFSDWVQKIPHYRIIIVLLIPLIFIFSGPPLHFLLQIPPINLVGSGGEPYSREAAIWIRDNISPKGVFLALDTRTANVIKYYSNNDALALHSNRNPAYIQVDNPDELILNGKINYLVYDVYLSEKLRYLREETKELNELITKYNAMPIYTEYNTGTENNGKTLTKPALIIYSLNGTEEN